jgi:phosphate-selective porin OprO/OprP
MNARRATCVFAIATLAAVAGLAGEVWAEEARTVLEEILTIMRQSGQITEEQRKALLERAEREAAQAQAEREKARQGTTAALQAGIEQGRPFLRSADGDFRLQLGGRLHVDYDVAEHGARTLAGATLNDRFLVRRARLETSGTLFRWIDFRVEGEFTEATVSLKNGFLDLRFSPEVQVRAGQYKVPFSLDQLTTANFLDFVERSVVDELAPGYDAGASVHGAALGGVVGYDLGVFNGAGEDAADTSDGKDLAGRVVVAPFKTTKNSWLQGLQVAGDFTWGDQDLGVSAQGRTTARTSNRFGYFAPQTTRGDRTRWGADLAWVVGPASVKFEYDQQRNERTHVGIGGADLADVVATGWYVTATYLLTGEAKVFNGPVVPRRPFSPVGGKWGPGAWELAVRWAELHFGSDDPVDFFDGNVTNGITGGGPTAENGVRALTVGLNWYLNSRVRYMANWTTYQYDTLLGTPFSCGQPTCTASQLTPGGDSWEVLSRIMLWF